MKKKVIVLGCGLVGATIARDLAADPDLDVTVADVSRRNLDRVARTPGLATRESDLGSRAAVAEAIAPFDVVAGAMPSALGFMVLQAVIEAGKPFCDISFMPEDPLELDARAADRGVTAVVDCGVAPGLANLVIGRCAARLHEIARVAYYVGGLPRMPQWPYGYRAPFAPADVIEEYTRPARMVIGGRRVTKPALSDVETIEFPAVGPLEAFNTDGLRTLLRTIPAENMVEKTLRHPGHVELMRVLRETGFFRKDEIDVGGVKVRPLDVTSRLLFPLWETMPGEEEFTLLRVVVEGRRAGVDHRFQYDLHDEGDPATGQSSMARTTGFPCAIVTRLLARGEIPRRGVLPPEVLGQAPGLFEGITAELAVRGVQLTASQGAGS
jgi:saccharopine dehydrogenase-like NADP-dependent oxidoreductase